MEGVASAEDTWFGNDVVVREKREEKMVRYKMIGVRSRETGS